MTDNCPLACSRIEPEGRDSAFESLPCSMWNTRLPVGKIRYGFITGLLLRKPDGFREYGGVPVFNRPSFNPAFSNEPDNPTLGPHPIAHPPAALSSMHQPLRKGSVVIITVRPYTTPMLVSTPTTRSSLSTRKVPVPA